MKSSSLGRWVVALAVCLVASGAGPARASMEWEAVLYLWATGMEGATKIRGNEADVDVAFSDLASNLDLAGALHLEGAKEGGGVGFFFDVFYADLSMDLDQPLEELGLTMSFLEGAVTYATDDNFQLFLGARNIKMDSTLKFDFRPPGVIVPLPDRVEGDVSWTDLMVGGRVSTDLGEKWAFWTRFDIAGFGLSGSSRFTWNLAVMGRYRFARSWSLAFGYGVLDMDYADPDKGFEFDVRVDGPVLAVSYAF